MKLSFTRRHESHDRTMFWPLRQKCFLFIIHSNCFIFLSILPVIWWKYHIYHLQICQLVAIAIRNWQLEIILSPGVINVAYWGVFWMCNDRNFGNHAPLLETTCFFANFFMHAALFSSTKGFFRAQRTLELTTNFSSFEPMAFCN